ncbi:MAG: hypothetical protein ACK55I_47805, partial [bacterium]
MILGLRPSGDRQRLEPRTDLRGSRPFGLPLPLVGGEHLHAVQSQRDRLLDRMGRTTGGAAMAPDARHVTRRRSG